jgi:hypothetical protein
MKTYILLLISAFVFSVGCSKFEIDESSTLEMLECDEAVPTTTEPCMVTKSHYIYNAEYAGRTTLGSNQTTADGSLSRVFPTGWYEGNSANVRDTDLTSTNIASGTTIFGVTGDLQGSVFALCTAPGSTDAEGKIGASCKAETGQYVYDTSYGGRGNICAEEVTINAPCWLPSTGKYIITNAAIVANCNSQGIINTQCVVAATNYWYTTEYGGRAANCPMNVPTGTPCWTNQSNTYVRSGIACAAGYNGGSCVITPPKYVYTTEYGGRNVLCTSNNVGSCWFEQPKTTVEPNLSSINIKIGETIFGISGVFTGVLTQWGSGMSRITSSSVNVISSASETTTYSAVSATALPSDYRPVPRITASDDAYNLTTQVTLVNRTGWSTTTCGTSQTAVGLRIADCATVFGANATWDGRASGHNGEGIWKLVTRTGNASAGKGREVWQDQSTGLMWSSVVSTGLNWCKASGSSNSVESNIVAGNYNEDDPNDICDNSFYQNQSTSPISACEDTMGFSNTDPDIDNAGKGGLSRSSNPKVAWRIPSMYDYMVANHDGLRFVMPDALNLNTSGAEWTATIDSTDRLKAWLFDPTTGTRSKDERSFNYAVRCIGR